MILLASTSDRLRVQSGTATTIDVQANWVDLPTVGAIAPDRTNTKITSATTSDVVGGPASGTKRGVKEMTIRNAGSAGSLVTVLHTDGTTIVEKHKAFLAPGAAINYSDGAGFVTETRLELPGDLWGGDVIAAVRDGNPNYVISQMQLAGNVAPTPTNITATVARCEWFRPAYGMTVATLRWYGVGATAGIYQAAVYRWSDLARMTDQISLTTTLSAWNSATLAAPVALVAGELYFMAVSPNTTGTTPGVGAMGGTVAATTGAILVAPTSWPGNLNAANLTAGRFQFATTAGALPATANTPVAQAAWTGGMPAFFLDAA